MPSKGLAISRTALWTPSAAAVSKSAGVTIRNRKFIDLPDLEFLFLRSVAGFDLDTHALRNLPVFLELVILRLLGRVQLVLDQRLVPLLDLHPLLQVGTGRRVLAGEELVELLALPLEEFRDARLLRLRQVQFLGQGLLQVRGIPELGEMPVLLLQDPVDG